MKRQVFRHHVSRSSWIYSANVYFAASANSRLSSRCALLLTPWCKLPDCCGVNSFFSGCLQHSYPSGNSAILRNWSQRRNYFLTFRYYLVWEISLILGFISFTLLCLVLSYGRYMEVIRKAKLKLLWECSTLECFRWDLIHYCSTGYYGVALAIGPH